jgi:hypothetical protein
MVISPEQTHGQQATQETCCRRSKTDACYTIECRTQAVTTRCCCCPPHGLLSTAACLHRAYRQAAPVMCSRPLPSRRPLPSHPPLKIAASPSVQLLSASCAGHGPPPASCSASAVLSSGHITNVPGHSALAPAAYQDSSNSSSRGSSFQ